VTKPAKRTTKIAAKKTARGAKPEKPAKGAKASKAAGPRPIVYHAQRRVEFRDTDAAGIMHFSAFFNYMEQVEHEFLRHLGMSVFERDDEGAISWPRVAVSCDFQGAVRFEDILDIAIEVIRRGEKSVTYGFRFTHADRPVADGRLTTVCCRLDGKAPPRSIPIPDWIVALLEGRDSPKRPQRHN
jgi:4-hydroxybenzoyl-CoA thioesterase/acyl-CoA thioester hydrolase